jgi:hypothetical protein
VATVTLDPADRYIVFAGTGEADGSAIFDGFPCPPGASGPAFGSDYLLCVTVTDDGAPAPPGCPPLACPWDISGDGAVTIVDLIALLSAWGPNPGNPADFNADGVVNIVDLLKLLSNWGPC